MNRDILASSLFITIYSALFTCLLGIVDYMTGYELNFFVFYYISIAYVAWKTRIYQAFIIAQLSTIVWLLADVFAGHDYTSFLLLIWNTLLRFSSFFLIAFIVAKIKTYIEKERQITAELRAALKQVKTLQGLLPICANCKKVRLEEEGYWEQVESYISRHSDIKFTHGICEDCARKLYPELYDLPFNSGGEG